MFYRIIQKLRINSRPMCVFIVLTICIIFYFGPCVIHHFYRSGVLESQRLELKSEYNDLSNQELKASLTALEKQNIHEARMNIYYWFHARGWNIDEGWHENPLQRKQRDWKELIAYWKL